MHAVGHGRRRRWRAFSLVGLKWMLLSVASGIPWSTQPSFLPAFCPSCHLRLEVQLPCLMPCIPRLPSILVPIQHAPGGAKSHLLHHACMAVRRLSGPDISKNSRDGSSSFTLIADIPSSPCHGGKYSFGARCHCRYFICPT
ncbi:hypothetical protein B0J14DRAFT_146901 [Halenospora varia]|nr:hypothetical protein B0J14DRAFT_146901 [Halenospora varia]